MTNSEVLIEAKQLIKRYGDFTAVAGIDFQVRKGESFRAVGLNLSALALKLAFHMAVHRVYSRRFLCDRLSRTKCGDGEPS